MLGSPNAPQARLQPCHSSEVLGPAHVFRVLVVRRPDGVALGIGGCGWDSHSRVARGFVLSRARLNTHRAVHQELRHMPRLSDSGFEPLGRAGGEVESGAPSSSIRPHRGRSSGLTASASAQFYRCLGHPLRVRSDVMVLLP
jgi:hypothetical protein